MTNRNRIKLLKRASKDLIAETQQNKSDIKCLQEEGLMSYFGTAPKGPAQGKKCFYTNEAGKAYLKETLASRKEDRRFWIAVFANPISAIIGAVIGYLLSNHCP